jgi:CRP-like cAMP-binding protein
MNVTAEDALIREGAENERVYLVLSGALDVCRGGQPVRDPDGSPVRVTAGGVVGEISALRGISATATVQGEAVVLAMSKAEVLAELPSHPDLRASMEEVARQRLAVLAENGYRVV